MLKSSLGSSEALVKKDFEGSFFTATVEYGIKAGLIDNDVATEIQNRFLYLGNCLASATQVSPSDINSLGFLVKVASAFTGLGCEVRSHGQMELAVQILKTEMPKSLFSLGLQAIYLEQQNVINSLKEANLSLGSLVEKFWRRYEWTPLQRTLEGFFAGKIAQVELETLTGFFAQFPLAPSRKESQDGRVYFGPVGSLSDLMFCVGEVRSIFDELRIKGEFYHEQYN